MKLLFLGDIIGKPGRDVLGELLPPFRLERKIDLVVANAENVAGGSGITTAQYKELLTHEIDVITLGDHAYKQKEIFPILEKDPRIVRPANFPPAAPGRGWTVFETSSGTRAAVIVLLGRTFMRPVDCPFLAADRILAEIAEAEPKIRVIFVDVHAEATSDKQLLGRYLDGRVSAVLGTHTHVATADETIFPGGTAFQCDVGMCGPFNSIIGRRVDRVLETVITFRPTMYDVARGESGHATAVERIDLRE